MNKKVKLLVFGVITLSQFLVLSREVSAYTQAAEPKEVSVYTSADDRQEVKFNDKNLKTAIEKALGKITITVGGMRNYKGPLDLSGRGIRDITGLEYLTSVDELNLSNNNISDITPLSSLTNLKYLHLDYNNISDLSPLSNLTQLEYINIQNNKIESLSPFENMKKLHALIVSNNSISDVKSITSLLKGDNLLEEIDLSNNQIKDKEELISLANKNNVKLDITGNPDKDDEIQQPEEEKTDSALEISDQFQSIVDEGIVTPISGNGTEGSHLIIELTDADKIQELLDLLKNSGAKLEGFEEGSEYNTYVYRVPPDRTSRRRINEETLVDLIVYKSDRRAIELINAQYGIGLTNNNNTAPPFNPLVPKTGETAATILGLISSGALAAFTRKKK